MLGLRTGWLPLLAGGFAAIAGYACGTDGANTPPLNDGGAGDAAPTTYDFSAFEAELFGGAWATEGAVVMVDGQVVYEKYAAGFDATKRHITYSVSKSIGAALVGVAVGEGLLSLDDSVCKHVAAPTGADPSLCDTTIGHALRMTSGLDWTEDYGDPDTSNVLPMLYGDEADMGAYVATRPRAAAAGARWLYSSGDSNLVARSLRAALGARDMRAWAKEKLFDPAGLSSVVFEADRAGSLVFSSSCFMTPRDMARFGQLYLDDGVLAGKRILPEGWVALTRQPAPPVADAKPRDPARPPGDSGGSYGVGFWLNAVSESAPADTWMYPKAPVGTYSAEGHWGQKIFVVPSHKLVVVRVGNDRSTAFDSDPMLGHAVSAVTAAGGSR